MSDTGLAKCKLEFHFVSQVLSEPCILKGCHQPCYSTWVGINMTWKPNHHDKKNISDVSTSAKVVANIDRQWFY